MYTDPRPASRPPTFPVEVASEIRAIRAQIKRLRRRVDGASGEASRVVPRRPWEDDGVGGTHPAAEVNGARRG